MNNEKLTWENWAKGEPKAKVSEQDCGVLDAAREKEKTIGFKAFVCNAKAVTVCEFKTKERFQLRKFEIC